MPKALVKMEELTSRYIWHQFVLRGVESQVRPIPVCLPPSTPFLALSQNVPPVDLERDAMTELTSNTDDAVLRDPFGHLNDEDDGDDEIVWDPNPSAPADPSPVLAARVANIHVSSPSSGRYRTHFSQSRRPHLPSCLHRLCIQIYILLFIRTPASLLFSCSQTTAEDLLKGFMDLGRPSR
ncbi:hypothetical protein BT96DRAFT_325146 [Gymnopus androsaceus JB14]|uniref:Uncharacterized protein n=1 Tax=Gymnopus androsaceus JB14 TaxID=1447944 RepID=A0A6A4I7W8_9AGAR|nr:hypothetical protein BT96DRAFT_325146 [Gymnopus androsaceus JB14]